MRKLLVMAEYIKKNTAICVVCGNPASRTQKIVADDNRVKVGAADIYEARCRKCHDPKLPQRLALE